MQSTARTSERPGYWREGSPLYSVCKLGTGRYFWIAYRAGTNLFETEPVSGQALDEATAVADAVRAAGPGPYPAHRMFNTHASGHYRKRLCEQRAQRRSETGGTGAVELVYLYYPDYDGSPAHFSPRRVVKKTARFVYVADEHYDPARPPTGEWWDYDVRTKRLDRATLEREGHARAYEPGTGAYISDYYLRPELPWERAAGVPPCLEALGLVPPCTPRDVKRAYRKLVGRMHPDRGGSHEGFLALHQAYQQALRLAETAREGVW